MGMRPIGVEISADGLTFRGEDGLAVLSFPMEDTCQLLETLKAAIALRASTSLGKFNQLNLRIDLERRD